MLYFTVDLFIDALILLLHTRNETVNKLINSMLDVYEQETKSNTYADNEIFNFYVSLIKELLVTNTTVQDNVDIEAYLLKFKNNPLVRKDPEIFTSLRKIFTDTTPLSKEKYEYLMKHISNCLLWYEDTKIIKRMFSKMAGTTTGVSVSQQESVLSELSGMCEEIIQMNKNGLLAKEEDDHQARKVDFDDKESLAKALKVYQDTSVTNVFQTGWKGLNRAFGKKGGFTLGESIVFNSLPFSGKSLMLLNFARWVVTLNKVSDTFKNPTCLFFSLENETPQNLMMLFKALYCNKYKQLPPPLSEEEIAEFCYESFRIHGWKLIIDRRLGTEFGFPELVSVFEQYTNAGYTPLVCIIDYMNLMKKNNNSRDSKEGNWIQLRELYSNTVNYLKSKNCCLITAHQLNRRAAEIVQQNPMGAVKKFDISMLADGMDPQREIDCAFYLHKELNQFGDAFLTLAIKKHRYDDSTPDNHKVFAYRFLPELGILDDIYSAEDECVYNIYADKFRGKAKELDNTTKGDLFGD